jgi:hypothetical protein
LPRLAVPMLMAVLFLAVAGWAMHLAATADGRFGFLALLAGVVAASFGAAAVSRT